MTDTGIDYEALAATVEGVREMVNATVRGLIEDGFTDEQAREITTAFFRTVGKPIKEDES